MGAMRFYERAGIETVNERIALEALENGGELRFQIEIAGKGESQNILFESDRPLLEVLARAEEGYQGEDPCRIFALVGDGKYPIFLGEELGLKSLKLRLLSPFMH